MGKLITIFVLFLILFPASTSYIKAQEQLDDSSDSISVKNVRVESSDINNNGLCEDFTVYFTINNDVYSGWKLTGKILDQENQELYSQKELCIAQNKKCRQDEEPLFYFFEPRQQEYSIYFKTEQLEVNKQRVLPVTLMVNIERLITKGNQEKIGKFEQKIAIPASKCIGFEEKVEAEEDQKRQILAKIASLIEEKKYREADYEINYVKSRYNWERFSDLFIFEAKVKEKLGMTYEAANLYLNLGNKSGNKLEFVRLIAWFWTINILIILTETLLIYFLYKHFKASQLLIFQATLIVLGGNLISLVSSPGGCPGGGLECLGNLMTPFILSLILSGFIWLFLLIVDIVRLFEFKDHDSIIELINKNAGRFLVLLVNIIIVSLFNLLVFSPIFSLIVYPQNIAALPSHILSANFFLAHLGLFIIILYFLVISTAIPSIIALSVWLFTRYLITKRKKQTKSLNDIH